MKKKKNASFKALAGVVTISGIWPRDGKRREEGGKK